MSRIWRSAEPPARVYFIVSSKEGQAALSIHHPSATQLLVLPTYPNEAVSEALPYLEPVFAHYAKQWRAIDVGVTYSTNYGARGFWLASPGMPEAIILPEAERPLLDIHWKHLTEETRWSWSDKDFDGRLRLRATPSTKFGFAFQIRQRGQFDGSKDEDVYGCRFLDEDVCVPAAEAGIEPWSGNGA